MFSIPNHARVSTRNLSRTLMVDFVKRSMKALHVRIAVLCQVFWEAPIWASFLKVGPPTWLRFSFVFFLEQQPKSGAWRIVLFLDLNPVEDQGKSLLPVFG